MSRPNLPGPKSRFYATWKFMRDPFVSYRQWRQKYGDTFLVKALNGDVVATCNREHIRAIFALPEEAVRPFAVETIRPLMGGASVILVEGQQHRRERAMLSPSFHGERIAGQAELVRDIAVAAGRHWHPGQTIRMMDVTLDISLEVIIQIVFGVQSKDRIEQFKTKIKKFVSSFHPVLAFSKLLQRPVLGLSPWNKFVQARDDFHQLLYEEIEMRRDQQHQQEDLLTRLLDARYDDGKPVSVDGIRDQLVTMLLAGHETTQIAMAWAMSWLYRNPDTLAQLRSELDGLESTKEILGCQYLEGVCNESLRLNSVVSDIARTLKQPLKLPGLELPAGTNLALAICLVHEDPELYPDPFQFRPERWIDTKRKPHEFMPFGGGIRRCIGATLAMLEMKMTIATWVQHFDFALPHDAPDVEPVYRRNITMAPKSGIPLIYVGERLSRENMSGHEVGEPDVCPQNV